MAIMTNNNVATILLTDSLLIPQTPCPEVHPLPSFVPKPTKNPPTIIKGIDLVISKLALLISKYIDGPMINPNKNKILANLLLLLVMALSNIPLIPANLPVV